MTSDITREEGGETCGILILRLEAGMGRDGCATACDQPRGSCDGVHRFTAPTGRRFEWEDDHECDCCPPEARECFVYREVSNAR